MVRGSREERRWRVVEPAGAEVPPDLIEATIATLTAGQAAEKLAAVPRARAAGLRLDAPSATVEVVTTNTSAPGHGA